MSEDVRDCPQFTAAAARRLAEDLFAVEAAAALPLPSERDQNFLLDSANGARFVLKLANAATRRETLDCQNQAMRYLATQTDGPVCPTPCTSRNGELIEVVTSGAARHFARMLPYVPGVPLAEVNPHTPQLLERLGRFVGKMTRTLQNFDHPAAHREIDWDLGRASAVIRQRQSYIADVQRQRLVEHFVTHYEQSVAAVVPQLRTSVIHGDANDFNVLVTADPYRERDIVALLDFGDMVFSCTLYELAVCLAYAMLGKADPVAAAAHVVAGYHDVFPLGEDELPLLFLLACMRLCTSVCMAAYQRQLQPDNDYLSVSETQAWQLLERLSEVNANFAHYTFRHACKLPPCPASASVVNWLKDETGRMGRVVDLDLRHERSVVFDLSVDSREFALLQSGAGPRKWTQAILDRIKSAGAAVGVGRYNEARVCYRGDQFKSAGDENDRWRTIHLGMDLFLPAGSPVLCPLDGVVHGFADNDMPMDYGPTVIIEHAPEELDEPFYTLYGHLSRKSLERLATGAVIRRGEQIGVIGEPKENGGWPPHLHFQLMCDVMDGIADFPGVATDGERAVWLDVCPDPNLILGIPEDRFPADELSREEILSARDRHLGPSLSVSYRRPLKIVRGAGQYLYDETGRPYLDAVNNVCHVGHCHPRVVEAGQQQIALLNTNTRYLHDNIVRYGERLCATLPDPLRVCFFVCSGSEANDLALRLARTFTGHRDVIVVDGAYHGNLSSLIEISPYKFDGPGGGGAPPHVHKVPMPDRYRGQYRDDDDEVGAKYAGHVQAAIRAAQDRGHQVAAFFCESVMSCGGQIVLPRGYLKEAYRHVRAAGGVCVADEVQVGFGRVGTHLWAFETQDDAVPDIVTLGKPIGNGHPLAAVITTPEIADAFANGMEYFNTFGGNPVSCAVGLAVLDVLRDEQLQSNALSVGTALKAGLEELKTRHPVVGDVRGLGLFLGVELVLDRESRAPAGDIASYVVERMKDHGILLSTDGPCHNVLKIKPPLVFTADNAQLLVRSLDKVLAEDPAQPPDSR